jgi:hypothetical protein
MLFLVGMLADLPGTFPSRDLPKLFKAVHWRRFVEGLERRISLGYLHGN